MELAGRVLAVVALTGAMVWFSGRLARRWSARVGLRRSDQGVAEPLLALLLRFLGALAVILTVALRGGDERVALVSAAGATYFAAILVDTASRLRRDGRSAAEPGAGTRRERSEPEAP